MSKCPACEAAAANALSGLYQASCLECSARMLAQAPAFFRSSKTGEFDPAYLAALKSTFGAQWRRWHARVKEWAQRIEQARTLL